MFKNPKLWKNRTCMHYLLMPFSWLWLMIGRRRGSKQASNAVRVSVPVICVGNVVMGGAGKTPTVIALVEMLKQMGHQPHILSRGYGAYIRDVMCVDPTQHTYLQVGDEPLLLAKTAPTWAGPNRVLSAEKAIEAGATILVLDDGLQNQILVKDLSFLVVDEIQGLGNGMIFPAGPLREPIEKALERIDAVIVIGDKSPVHVQNKKMFHAKLQATKSDFGQRVVAFCGMGCPEKFQATLVEQGYNILEFVTFADHHPYTIPELIQLNRLQKKHDAVLITTTKDWLRLPHAYRSIVDVLPVDLVFREPTTLREFVEEALAKYRKDPANTHLKKVNL